MRLVVLTILLALSVAARPQVAGTFEQPDALVKAGVKRVRCMLRDSRGFLWIGTETGLFRYDGTNVDLLQHEADGPVALPNNMIAGLAEDQAGNIWVGTMHGAARVDPNTLQCTVYSTPRHNIDFDFDLKPLVSRDGRVWLGGNEGLTVLEGGRFRTVWRGKSNPSDNAWYVNAITEWKRDTLALGTFRGLVLYNTRDGGYRRLFRQEDITVTRLLVDTHGRLWMGTWANGCWILDSSGRVYTSVAPDKPVRGRIRNIVTSILETGGPAAPRYWVSTEDAIYQMGEPPAKGMNPRDIAEVATTGAACLTEDNEHHVWIGGVTVKRVFAGHSQFAALPTEIKGLITGIQGVTYHHQPAIAFTTWYVPGGLTVTNPDATSIYYKRTVKGDGANVSGLALDSKGRYWLSTLTGLDILDSGFQPVPHADTLFRGRDQLVTTRTNGVLIHRDTAWVAYYRRGLSIYDMHFHLLRSFARNDGSGMADDLINCMFEHGGTVWLGGDNGLYRYDAAAGRFHLYNLNPDQSSFNVSDIAALPGGDLVLATGSGLFRFSPATGSGSKIRSPLFGDNVIEAVTVDAGGDIWFVNREHLVYYRVNSGHFMLFGTEDGLDVHDDLNTLRSPDGVHFFAGGNDIVYTFDRSSRNTAARPMPLYLHSIQVNDSTLPRSAVASPLQLNYTQDRITLEFGAINLVKPEQNVYAYMLTDVDNKWIYSTRNFASYANLAPGHYTFQLKAQNYAGVWSEVLRLPVTISPPYWDTWWFRLISALLIGAAIFFSVRYVVQRNLRDRILRLQQEQAVEKERNRIARDMHDDLGSGLTKIAILSEVTKARLQEPGAAVSNLDVISNASRELVDNLEDIVWVLNPRNDSFSSLLLYIKDHVEDFFEPSGIACTVVSDPVVHDFPLSEEKRRNIFLTVKEACNNILKYSGCTEVWVRVGIGEDGFEIEIADNGRGFEVREVGQFSNGLRNMKNRMEQIGGRFHVQSEKGRGTRVRLEVAI